MKTKLNEIVNIWLEGAETNTKRRYKTAWDNWQKWLKFKRIKEPKPLDCQRYTNLLIAKYSHATTHNTVSALRSIYSYLKAIEAVKINPWLGARHYYSTRQKAQVRPTASLTPKQVKQILEASSDPKNPTQLRNSALIYLLFAAGLRRSEARMINLGDIMTQEETLVVRLKQTKNGQDVLQPVASFAATRLSDLVSQRMLEGASDNSPLFVDYLRLGFNRISDKTIHRIFTKTLAALGIKAAPHAARAAYATRLLELGKSEVEVARALRHKDFRSVHIYDKRRRQLSDNVGLEVNYEK